MTRRFVFLASSSPFVLALPAMAIAQAKPNFSGKWIQDMEKSDPAGGGGGGRGPAGPQNLTITQTATELTIERETPNGAMKTVYKLDGSESVNAMGRGGEVKTQVAPGKAARSSPPVPDPHACRARSRRSKSPKTRSLEADGTLTVVTATKCAQGDTTRKIVFKKA